MATFVLIHGAWHGKWCWQFLAPILEARGHRVVAPDLLGMGDDRTPLADVTLATWTDQVAALVTAQDEPVILVGHSRGGLVISEVAERVPDRVQTLVYLCAYLLKNGQTVHEVAQTSPTFEAMVAAITMHDDGTASVLRDEAKTFFYNRTSAERVSIAEEQLGREPISTFAIPTRLTEARYGSVPRVYIECEDDQAVPLVLQRAMQEATACGRTIRLHSDHSPFFSMPNTLADALEASRPAV